VFLAATAAAAVFGPAAAPARAVATTVAADSVVVPSTLHFGVMEPGEAQSQTATLTTDAPADATFVRAVVSGTGSLAGHLSTSVEACAVAWTADACSVGAALLAEGPVGTGIDTTIAVPVPAAGVAYLRVTLALDNAAPANGASTVSYELSLVAPDEVTPTPSPTRAPTPAPTDGPTQAPTPPPAQPPVGQTPPLSTTGAETAALGAAALALVLLGLTVRGWLRGRSPEPTGPDDSGPHAGTGRLP
jgi:hypothetical protein